MIPFFDIKSLRSRLSNVSSAVRLQRMRVLSRFLSVRPTSTVTIEDQKKSQTVIVPVEFDVVFHNQSDYFPRNGLYTITDGSTDVFEYLVQGLSEATYIKMRDGYGYRSNPNTGRRYQDRFASDVYLSPDSRLKQSYQIAEDDGIPYTVDVIFDRDHLEKNKKAYYNEQTMLEYIFGSPDSAGPQLANWFITNFATVYTEWDTWEPENNIARMTRYKKVIDSALEKS